MQDNLDGKDNQLFDSKLRQLRVQLRRHMNGVAASLYRSSLSAYSSNYGVSLQHLREVARLVEFVPEECDRLWSMGGRELMLTAALALPAEGLTPERLAGWAATAPNSEVVEVLAFDRTGHMPSIAPLCACLLDQLVGRSVELALHTAARGIQNQTPDAAEAAKPLLRHMAQTSPWTLPEASGVSLLCRMAIRRKMLYEEIEDVCRHAQALETDCARKFLYEVETERMAFG